MVDIIRCCLDSIRQISDDIRDAIVYLDAGCTESFQFTGAFSLLLELGARTVCSLEKVSPLDQVGDWSAYPVPVDKVVIITSRLLSDAHRYVLCCLDTLQGIHYCTIFTSLSEIAHSAYPDSPLGPDAFREYELLLSQDYEELVDKRQTSLKQPSEHNLDGRLNVEEEGWSELASNLDDVSDFDSTPSLKVPQKYDFTGSADDVSQKLVVHVYHFPLILSPFSPRAFVLPSEGSIAEACLSVHSENSISPGLPSVATGAPIDGEDVPPGATLTAQFLYHLAAKMDLKLEIFSLGDLSNLAGNLLMDMSSLYDVSRRKRSAGLLLIDRTLDLLTPCCHGDSLVDRIFSSLTRKEPAASVSVMKSSHSQLKYAHSKITRLPLDVKIPVGEIIREEIGMTDKFHLLENIEAFLRGWNSGTSEIVDLTHLSKKLNSERPLNHLENALSGSFVSNENFHGANYIEALLDRRTKDGAVLIRKWLQETLREQNMSFTVRGRAGFPSNLELIPMIKALARSQTSLLKNKGIIQLAAGTVAALDELSSARWDASSSAEKILNVNSRDTSQSLAAQISDLISKSAVVNSQGDKNSQFASPQGLLSFKDALLLTIVGYILAGENFPTFGSRSPFSWQEEHFIQEAVFDAIMENPAAAAELKFLQELAEDLKSNTEKKIPNDKVDSVGQVGKDDFEDEQWESWGDEDDEDTDKNKEQQYGDMQLRLEVRDRVDNLFKFLHKISSLGSSSLFRGGSWTSEARFSDDPYSSRGLLHKILTGVLAKQDLPDLHYHSSTVGRLFKSGFGRFGLRQAKPSLADHDVILVFVIGGINAVEVREAQEALSESSRPDTELIIGGTSLLTPDDMFNLLLGENSFISTPITAT